MKSFNITRAAALTVLAAVSGASAVEFQLVTGVGAGTSPGDSRGVFSGSGSAGLFFDGQRLGGTPSAEPISPGSPGYIQQPNEFGSLSFMFRRGSIPAAGRQFPLMSIDYLGGPLLDLDGDLNNGSRSLTPVGGQNAVAIPGSTSHIDLSFNTQAGLVSLNNFDVNGNNVGAGQTTGDQLVTVNTLAGTSPTGAPGAAINPSFDTRSGTVSAFAGTGGNLDSVYQVSDLGYEFWQDTLSAASSGAPQLGTAQFLGSLSGWLIERDGNGNFPTLAGQGLGSTMWPAVNASGVGATVNTANGVMGGVATIVDGVADDDFSDADDGGLDLTDFGGDLGAYLDAVVIPNIDPLSESFVYLESAGFGVNNSFDPVFGDSVGYDVVLIAQSAPVPEPATVVLLAGAALAVASRRRFGC